MRQYDVYLANLDPVRGAEINQTRPAVIVSPDSMNTRLRTVVVAPLTSVQRGWPFRVQCAFGRRKGDIALDQIRCLDRSRLIRRLGALDHATAERVADRLVEIFEKSP